jgi:RNA polymerase sigma-70 factor, ECF subfamily
MSESRRSDLDAVVPEVYQELRRVAAAYMRREEPGRTVQATALVHDAYLRLMREPNTQWANRAHFCALAAHAMRQILVEQARARRRDKRGGARQRITLADLAAPSAADSPDLEALDEALTRLTAMDPELGRLVELRYFGGLSIDEAATLLEVSPATIKRRWSTARAWLRQAMES